MSTSQTIDLSKSTTLVPANRKKRLSEIVADAVTAAARYPDAFRAFRLDGYTDAQIMSIAIYNIEWTDALWRGATHAPSAGTRGLLLSRNKIIAPSGAWWINVPLDYAYGTYSFPNAGPGNDEYASDQGGFEIMNWNETWMGFNGTKDRVLFRAYHGGSDNVMAYSEGTRFEGAMRINGRAGNWRNPNNQFVVGFEAWDFGEASEMCSVFAHYCDVGIQIPRGTPYNAPGTTSVFSNTTAGIRIIGGGSITMGVLSGDDNPRLIQSVGGYGRPATCALDIQAIKSEWAVTPKDLGRTWKRQHIELEGEFDVHIGTISHATGAYQDSLFFVKPDVNTSHIKVDNLSVRAFTGVASILHDTVNKKTYMYDNGYISGIQEFRWSSVGGGKMNSWPNEATEISAPHQNPLGYLNADPVTGQPIGSFDRVNGLPTWSDVTGTSNAPVTPPNPNPIPPDPIPPVTPTLKWSTSFDGTDITKLKTGTTVNATAHDTGWSGLQRLASGTGTTHVNSIFPTTVTATKVILKGCTFISSPDWSYLNSAIRVMSNGDVKINGSNAVVTTLSKTKKDVTITFPNPIALETVIGKIGGQTPSFSAEAIEIYG